MRNHIIRRTGTGFTLVELLVVIGIIAVLIAILLPALNKAREAANSIACGANMRQIGMAALQYVNDYGPYPPAGVTVWDNTAGKYINITWDLLLLPYFGATALPHRVYVCPSDKVDRYILNGGTWNIQPFTKTQSYSAVRTFSAVVATDGSGLTIYPTKSLCDAGDDSKTYPYASNSLTYGYQAIKYMKFVRPNMATLPTSQIFLYAECNQYRNVQGTTWVFWIKGPGFQVANDGKVEDGAGFNHSSGTRMNYVFADGHVEAINPLETSNAVSTGSKFGYWQRD